MDAEAKKIADIKDAEARAEAVRIEAEAEAGAISAKGKAEAEAIRLKLEAEAEGMLKKAEAYEKYGGAAITQMVVEILPAMAQHIAAPLGNIDKVMVWDGGEGGGTSRVTANVTKTLASTFDAMNEILGLDVKDFISRKLDGGVSSDCCKHDNSKRGKQNKQNKHDTPQHATSIVDVPMSSLKAAMDVLIRPGSDDLVESEEDEGDTMDNL